MSDQEPPLLPHDFDGIREQDRDPPLWFTLLFYGTIVFGIVYVLHYHWGPGLVGTAAWREGMVELNETRARTATGPLPEAQLRELSRSPERQEKGRALYASSGCVACHGPDAAGTIGPNLTDRWWTHGNSMTEIVDVIAKGRGNGTMPEHGRRMSMDDITNLAIHLVVLNRAGAKPGKPHDPAREKDAPITY